MDLVSLNVTIGFCYMSGYEFHLYGENVSNLIQTLIIVVLLWYYKGVGFGKLLIYVILQVIYLELILTKMIPQHII